MPTEPVYIAQGNASATSTPVDIIERASPDIKTVTTASAIAGDTSIALASRSLFPQSGSFKARWENEVVLVTAGHGTGAGSFTITRGQDGTTAASHASGTVFAQVVGVQRVEPVSGLKQVSFKGRVASFRTTGRAGTSGQKLFAIHNAAGSPVIIDINNVKVDIINTAVRAITVEPVLVRLWKFTAVPTNGSALTKVALDSRLASNASVTVWGDASADKTLSGTTLTVTLPAGQFFAQEYGPRNFTAVGQEAADKVSFLDSNEDVLTLNAGEGLCVFLDYNTATFNPATDFWTASCDWIEYTEA